MAFRLPRRAFMPREGSFALPPDGQRTLYRVESGPRYDPQSHSVVRWIYSQTHGWRRDGVAAVVWCDGFDRAAVRDTLARLARRAADLERDGHGQDEPLAA